MREDEHIGRIAFVGAGRVAATLAWAMHRAGLPVTAVFGRTRRRAEEIVARIPGAIAADSAQDAADLADLVFVTVSDDGIAGVCEQLSWRVGHGVVHCSGATELEALGAAAAAGARVGAFHPMQMFANSDVALETLPGCTISIEAVEPLARTLVSICERLRCRPMRLPPGSRALYHASIYNVGPFLIALMEEAARIWRSFGATEQDTLTALLPLLKGTLAAVTDAGLAGGMGGCVARGDVGTVERHLAALEAFSPEMATLYRQLALRTIPLALTRGTLSPELADRIRRALEARRLS
jgi:predicted short-subunit dehydrogenase-like oxidoreductase (DUF2520 family)